MIAEPYRTWIDRWQKTIAAVRAIGGEADEIRIGPLATEPEIAATERKIRRRLPPSFRMDADRRSKAVLHGQAPRKPWGGLDPDCDLARMWRATLHLDL